MKEGNMQDLFVGGLREFEAQFVHFICDCGSEIMVGPPRRFYDQHKFRAICEQCKKEYRFETRVSVSIERIEE